MRVVLAVNQRILSVDFYTTLNDSDGACKSLLNKQEPLLQAVIVRVMPIRLKR